MRLNHGDTVGRVERPDANLFSLKVKLPTVPAANDFGYMFSETPDQQPGEADRLAEEPGTLAALDALGVAMAAADPDDISSTDDRVTPDSGKVPAGFTYFGQFVDHDITIAVEPLVDGRDVIFGDFTPFTSLDQVQNGRTPLLELDSVYGPTGNPDTQVPEPVDGKMVVQEVSVVGVDHSQVPVRFVPGKGFRNDLPRKIRSADPRVDREALIGDPRNDENLIVAQLHVAFLKAHNTLVDQGLSFDQARDRLTLMYQSVIVDDYLPRVCDTATLEAILADGPRFLAATGPVFMPIEFAAAGFRFGHSMVRTRYDFNLNFLNTDAAFAFTFTALQGNLTVNPPPPPSGNSGTDHFPHNWVVEWKQFLELDPAEPPQAARPIDAHLTPLLAGLRNTFGQPDVDIAAHLARRNLRRSYLFRLPTGQAVAAKVGVQPVTISAATTGLDQAALAPFADRTPLWLYVLAEAGQNGGRLGAVGTTILAETFVALIRRSSPSIFDAAGQRSSTDRHKLADIVTLAAEQDAAELS